MRAETDRNIVMRVIREHSSWLIPAVASALLHGAAAWVLLGGWWQGAAIDAPATRIQTQLMTLTYEVAEPEPPPVPEVKPAPPPEPVPDEAVVARKRLEEERERQLREKQHTEQVRQEKEQELAEQRAREERRAEEQRRAQEAEQQRLAAARARAEAAAMAQYQPINKSPPAYPRRALEKRIEGNCTVTYTVTPDGRVNKPRVIEDACDDPIFIRPSLEAARAFRYQPRIVNGQAVAVDDVRNTFRYRIQ
ncbi:MAG: energy transducer TonB [Porticoccaceae bacterium]